MLFLLANSAISNVYNHKLPYWDGAYLLRQFPRSLQTTVVEPWCHPLFCDITKLLLCIYLLCLLKPKFSWQWVSTRLVSCSKTWIYLQYFAVQWLWEGCHQPKLMHPALRSLGLRSPSTRPKGIIKWYQIKRSFTVLRLFLTELPKPRQPLQVKKTCGALAVPSQNIHHQTLTCCSVRWCSFDRTQHFKTQIFTKDLYT